MSFRVVSVWKAGHIECLCVLRKRCFCCSVSSHSGFRSTLTSTLLPILLSANFVLGICHLRKMTPLQLNGIWVFSHCDSLLWEKQHSTEVN